MSACVYEIDSSRHCKKCEDDLRATIQRIQENYDAYIADSVKVTQRVADERDAARAEARRLRDELEKMSQDAW